MTSSNPFDGIYAPVTGEQFVGREKELKILRDNTRKGFIINVVGLPRMGKTSLVFQCFTEEHANNWWVEEKHYAPLYFEVPEVKDPVYLWFAIRTAISRFLRRRKEKFVHLDNTHNLLEGEKIYQSISQEVDEIFDRTGLHLLFVIDEFDRVLRMKNAADVFYKLQTLTYDVPVIVCSRRPYSFIEKTVKGDSFDPGKVPLEIPVGLFNENDVKAYWERFNSCFSSFPSADFEKYKELVYAYTGWHPLLMNLMNHTLLSRGENPYEVWKSGGDSIKLEIRQVVDAEFNAQIPYVIEQGLMDTAKQLILGTSHMVTVGDLNRVLKYQFVRVVPSSEKKKMFGYTFGPYADDAGNQYICFSELTTHIFKNDCDPDISGYELLKNTEIRMRDLISYYLKEICDDVYPHDIDNEGHELWEGILYSRIVDKLPEGGDDAFQKNLDEMYRIRIQRESNDCNPLFDRRRINMLSSATLGQLWFVFIKWQWKDFFSQVLDPENAYRGNGEKWYRHVFMLISKWRNAEKHYYDEELPEEFIKTASEYASGVCRNIESWLEENKE